MFMFLDYVLKMLSQIYYYSSYTGSHGMNRLQLNSCSLQLMHWLVLMSLGLSFNWVLL